MRYWPNPVHKRETTEAGPAKWRPAKAPCPDMTVEERTRLLTDSVPVDPSDPSSRRFNVRRTDTGLEVYDAKCHRVVDGVAEFHGHPATYVPAKVLRDLRDLGRLTEPEYKRLIKDFGC